jgi:hypothetical protein
MFRKQQVQIEPYFWDDRLAKLPICVDLVKNYPQIKKEVLDFISNPEALHDYPKYKIYGGDNYLYDNYWKAVPISRFKEEYISENSNEQEMEFINGVIDNAKRNCPTVQKVIGELESEGNLANSFISRLLPGSIIHPHTGWVQNWMRIHLGLVCDPNCEIKVGEETRTWKEGKLIAFKDGGPYMHSVQHNGESERIILSIDVSIDYIQSFLNK